MKKKLFNLVLTFIIAMTSVINVIAAPQSVTFSSRKLSGVNMQSGSSSNYKTLTANGVTYIGFCLNKSLKSPTSGSTLYYKDTITDPGFIFIYENGYAGNWNVSLLGNGLSNDQRYYATQLALWLYQGKLSESSLNKSYPEATVAIKLYNEAKKAKATNYSIDIKSNDTDMFYDDTYYKSTLFNVKGEGYKNFTVTLVNATSYAEIVATTGKVYKSGDTLPAGTSFYVRIPKSKVYNDMEISVLVNTNATVNKVHRYTLNKSDYQDVGIMISETVKLSDSIKIKLTKEQPKEYDVSIIKKDAGTGETLAGATLELKDANGNVIDTWVTTTSPHVIKGLEAGVYSVTEIKAPEGYILNSTPIKFTVSGDNDTTKTITMYNTKETPKTGTVKISKQDITTKEELPGATLTIKDANGNVVATWVSTNEPHYVTNLTPGKYTLIETNSPSGYGLSDEIIEFTIDEDGNPSQPEIIMYNSPIPVTADINITLLIMGFIAFIAIGTFSTYKLIKQQ